jgi:hypothetical protein
MALRDAAVKELSEGLVQRHLPPIAFAGFLKRDLVVDIWQRENDRIIDELARKPQQAAPPAVVAPPPAKAKSKAIGPAVASQPVRPPPRPLRADPPPGEGEVAVTFLRAGVELDGELSLVGDRRNVTIELGRNLVQAGAADYAATANTRRAGSALADYAP